MTACVLYLCIFAGSEMSCTGVSTEDAEVHSSILEMVQCHGWDAPSLPPEPYCLIRTGCCCGLSSSVTLEPVRTSRKRPKDIEDVILVKFVLLVFVIQHSVNETRDSEASKASSNNFMKNLKVRLHLLILYEQKPAGQTWPKSTFVLKNK